MREMWFREGKYLVHHQKMEELESEPRSTCSEHLAFLYTEVEDMAYGPHTAPEAFFVAEHTLLRPSERVAGPHGG
jgi:hypothetical protein